LKYHLLFLIIFDLSKILYGLPLTFGGYKRCQALFLYLSEQKHKEFCMKKLRFFGLLAAAVLLAFALVISCGGGGEEPGIVDPGETPEPPRPIPPQGGGSAYVPPAPPALVVNKPEIALVLKSGVGEQLSASRSGVVWDSKDSSIAQVSASGYVTAVKAGKTTITAAVSGATEQVEIPVSVISSLQTDIDKVVTSPGDLAALNWAEINAYVNKIGINGIPGVVGSVPGQAITTIANLVVSKFEATTTADLLKLLITNAPLVLPNEKVTTEPDVIINYTAEGETTAKKQLAIFPVLNGASSLAITLADGWAFKSASVASPVSVKDDYAEIVYDLVYTMPVAADTKEKKLVIFPSAMITVSATTELPATNTLTAITTDGALSIAAGTPFIKFFHTTSSDVAITTQLSPSSLNKGADFAPALEKPVSFLARAKDPQYTVQIASALVDKINGISPQTSLTPPLYKLDVITTPAPTAFGLTKPAAVATGFYTFNEPIASRDYNFTFARVPTTVLYIRVIGITVTSTTDLTLLMTSAVDAFVSSPGDPYVTTLSDLKWFAANGITKATTASSKSKFIAEFEVKPVTTWSNVAIVNPTIVADSTGVPAANANPARTTITTSGTDFVLSASPDSETGAVKFKATYTSTD
jgi:hypothetical protein